jgi:hypothetical protein
MVGRGEPLLDGCNKLLSHSRREWIPMCMRLMVVQKELSTTENPWSFQLRDFLTSSIGALERNGIA